MNSILSPSTPFLPSTPLSLIGVLHFPTGLPLSIKVALDVHKNNFGFGSSSTFAHHLVLSSDTGKLNVFVFISQCPPLGCPGVVSALSVVAYTCTVL